MLLHLNYEALSHARHDEMLRCAAAANNPSFDMRLSHEISEWVAFNGVRAGGEAGEILAWYLIIIYCHIFMWHSTLTLHWSYQLSLIFTIFLGIYTWHTHQALCLSLSYQVWFWLDNGSDMTAEKVSSPFSQFLDLIRTCFHMTRCGNGVSHVTYPKLFRHILTFCSPCKLDWRY